MSHQADYYTILYYTMLESLLVTPGSLIYYNLRCYTGTSTGHTRLIIILLTHIILESLLVTTERLPYFTITRTRNGVKALYKSEFFICF